MIEVEAEVNFLLRNSSDRLATVGDLKQLVEMMKDFNIPDNQYLEECHIFLAQRYTDVDTIHCGEHIGYYPVDILITTHECEDS